MAISSAVGTSDTSSDWPRPGPCDTGSAETDTFFSVISRHSWPESAKAGLYVLKRTYVAPPGVFPACFRVPWICEPRE